MSISTNIIKYTYKSIEEFVINTIKENPLSFDKILLTIIPTHQELEPTSFLINFSEDPVEPQTIIQSNKKTKRNIHWELNKEDILEQAIIEGEYLFLRGFKGELDTSGNSLKVISYLKGYKISLVKAYNTNASDSFKLTTLDKNLLESLDKKTGLSKQIKNTITKFTD